MQVRRKNINSVGGGGWMPCVACTELGPNSRNTTSGAADGKILKIYFFFFQETSGQTNQDSLLKNGHVSNVKVPTHVKPQKSVTFKDC